MDKKFLTLCYGIYTAGMLMQGGPFIVVAAASIAILITVVLLHKRRKKISGDVENSHATWLIRTFWIGGSLWLPLLTVIGAVYFALNMDMSKITAASDSGILLTEAEVMHIIMNDNRPLLEKIFYAVTIIFGLWWLWRCWTGFSALKKDQPVTNPGRYF
jgi:uncharacterized membrane protein